MTRALRPTLTGLPVLETDRSTWRGPQAGDWPAFRDYRALPRIACAGGIKTAHEAAEQFAPFFGHWVLRGFDRLIAEDRATGQPTGQPIGQPTGHFGPMQWEDGAKVELTWSLWTATAEGKGLASETATEMRDRVLGPPGLTAARAKVHRDNAASHAIARRLGGHVAQNHRSHRLCERLGGVVDPTAPVQEPDDVVYRYRAGGAA